MRMFAGWDLNVDFGGYTFCQRNGILLVVDGRLAYR